VLILAMALANRTAHAATWHIEAEPEGINRITAIAALAASGDTIVIGPGLYYEHIDAAGKALTFIGREGRENTILDGSRPFAGDGGSIIYTSYIDSAPGPISVSGLTLQHGQGAGPRVSGGAILVPGDVFYRGSLHAQDCSFLDNDVGEGDSGNEGGAISVSYGDVQIQNCVFRGNNAHWGDAIDATFGSITIVGCEIDLGVTGHSTGVGLEFMASVRIEACIIKGAAEGSGTAAVVICGSDCEIRRNLITSDGTSAAMTMEIGACVPSRFTFEDNLVWWSKAPPNSQTVIVRHEAEGSIACRRNTFVGGGFAGGPTGGDPVYMENNIVVNAAVQLRRLHGGCVCCNDLWNTTLELAEGERVEHNISADPIFCDPEGGNFTISRRSPCSADSVPEGCQAMGAFAPDCDLLPVRKVTWGGLKHLLGGRR